MSSRRLSLACMRLGVLLTFVVAINAVSVGLQTVGTVAGISACSPTPLLLSLPEVCCHT